VRKRRIKTRETPMELSTTFLDNLQSLGNDDKPTDDICINDRGLLDIEWESEDLDNGERVRKMVIGHEY